MPATTNAKFTAASVRHIARYQLDTRDGRMPSAKHKTPATSFIHILRYRLLSEIRDLLTKLINDDVQLLDVCQGFRLSFKLADR